MRAALILPFLLIGACELTGDPSSLDNGQCPSGAKACFVHGEEQCVGMNDPTTGCNAPNCVSCDVKVANAVTTCSALNTCTIAACNKGYIDCNQNDADGCEVDVTIDVNNCGLCGTVCALEANSKPVCLNGVCTLQCAPGYADCNLKYSDGCETRITPPATTCP